MKQEGYVRLEDKNVGTVWIQRQGLYYKFNCRCTLTGRDRYKLIAICGKNSADLGLCVPVDGGFGLDTQIPIKRLGEGEISFRLVPKCQRRPSNFMPVFQEKPFGCISQLQKAHLAWQDGQIGIAFAED